MHTPVRPYSVLPAVSDSLPDSSAPNPGPTDWILPYIQKPVSRLARKLAAGTNLYEDLRQEGLHAATRAVPFFNPSASASLSTYVLRSAIHRMLDYLKRERRITRHTISGDQPAYGQDETLFDTLAYQSRFFDTPDATILRGQLRDALLALPLREHTFIQLSFYEELSQPEIAERFGVSRPRVGQILEQAIHRLRKQMT
jgi:RNA polymerase sigma factor (sigma-70 family)